MITRSIVSTLLLAPSISTSMFYAPNFAFGQGNACGDPEAGTCCQSKDTPFCDDPACCQLVCADDPFCCNTRWDSACAGRARQICPSCACAGGAEELFYPFNNDGTWTLAIPEGSSDNSSSAAIAIGFAFDFYGTTYNACFVNENGNLTFEGPLSSPDNAQFPLNTPPMVAAYWTDIFLDVNNFGRVWFKHDDADNDGAIDTFVATWENVVGPSFDASRRNTFQIVLTDGSHPKLNDGVRVALSYGEMCWGPEFSGGGGKDAGGSGELTPAVVGTVGDATSDFVLVGRFSPPGIAFDGPEGDLDGFDHLDGRLITARLLPNEAPTCVDCPTDGTIFTPGGESLDRTLFVAGPEKGQAVELKLMNAMQLAERGVIATITNGVEASLRLQWAPTCCDDLSVPVVLVATDDFENPAARVIELSLVSACLIGPDIVPVAGSLPESAPINTFVTATWTSRNDGNAHAIGTWSDAVYLSTSPDFDENAVFAGSATVNDANLAPGGEYSRSATLTMPFGGGTFFAFVVADNSEDLCERIDGERTALFIGTIQYTGGCGTPTAGNCCAEKMSRFCEDEQCCQLICSFDSFCCNNRWDGICADAAQDLCAVCNEPTICSGNGAQLLYPFVNDGTWTRVLDFGNDNSATQALPFAFNFFGDTFTNCSVNINGNVTFDGAFNQPTQPTFPIVGPKMVAAFLADVDLRSSGSGDIWRKDFDRDGNGAFDTVVFTWDNVGFAPLHRSRLNTFQLILTNGQNPDLEPGANVATSYANMCWTTGDFQGGVDGFGGTPALVGVNRGNGVDGVLLGRFNRNDASYDGPAGETDGIDFLDGRLFQTSIGNNLAPVAVDFPSGGAVVVAAGTTLDRTLTFTGPEAEQAVSLVVPNAAALAQRGVVLTTTDGTTASLRVQWTPGCCDAGVLPVQIVATDSAVPPGVANFTLNMIVNCTNGPDLVLGNGTARASATGGASIPVSWTGTNTGDDAGVASWLDRVFLSSDAVFGGSDIAVADVAVTTPDFAAGQSYQRSANVVLPNITGTRFVIVVGDVADTLCERDGAESNVLVIGPIAVTENQPPICTNYPSNGALATTPESPLDVTLEFLPPEADQSTTLEVFNAGSIIAAGATITEVEANPATLRIQWTPDCCDAGVYDILVRATDSMASPRFQDFPLRITVGCPIGPDLVVTSAIAPSNGFTGQAIAVTWTARNEGTAAANVSWFDRVRVVGSQGSDVSVQNSFPTFASGAQYQRTVAVTLPPNPGTYGIFIDGDVGDTLCERDGAEGSTRHVGDIVVIVPPRPDLVVESVTPISDGVLSGSSIKFSYVVRNIGNAPTAVASWRDLVILSPDAELAPPSVPLGVEHILLDPANPQFLLPNESYARNVEVVLPHDFSGSRRIAVYADGSGGAPQGSIFAVTEQNESNNFRFTAPFEVALEPQPDLKGVSMAVPSTAFSGTLLTINATVENRGDGPADPGVNWRVAVYLSENQSPDITTGDLFLGDRASNIVALEPDQVRALQLFLQLPIALSGQRFVKLQLDSSNGVSEFGFEGNNVFASTTPVEIFLSPPADLVLTAPTATPSVSFPGHVVRTSWQGTNEGAPLLPSQILNWFDRVYLSADAALDAGDRLLAERQRSTIDLGFPANLYDYTTVANVRLPNDLAAGNYFLLVQGDATNAIFEGNCDDACESNNVVASPITVEARFADLVAFDLVAPTSGAASESITISWKTRNQGDAVTPVAVWNDRMRLVGNGVSIEFGGTTRFGTLAIGGVYQGSDTAQVPLVPPGEYQLVLTADAYSECFEGSNDGNNAVTLPFTVTTDGADLLVDVLTLGSEPVSGKPFTIGCTIRNAGNRRTPSAAWNDACYLSRDAVLDSGDIRLATRSRGASLDEGASYNQQFTGTIPLGAIGDFFVIVHADANGQVFETSESNNTLASASPISVAPPRLPNLSVIAVSRGAVGTAGQPLEVTWTTANDSEFALTGAQWRDSVYLSLDQFLDVTVDIHIGTAVVSETLDPEATYTRSRSFTVPSGLTGAFYVIVRSDSLEQVAEANESDNIASATSDTDLSLPDPSDLVVADVFTLESELVLGQTYEFGRTVRNAGDQPVTGTWKDSIYLSSDNAWSINDRRIGSFQTVVGSGSPLAPDATITEEGFAEVTGVTPGTYHLIARTDVFNAISETNENNNVGGSLGTVLVRATPIELGVTFNGVQLGNGGVRYFEFDAPAGEPILVEFDHLNDSANIELFVKHGSVPTSGNFDASGRAPGEPEQQALVPSSRAGKYYVLVRNSGMVGTEAGFTIRASIVPYSVLSVEPSVVGNAGTATFAIEGARFDRETVVTLVDVNGLEHAAVRQRIESTSLIHTTFDMSAIAVGPCGLRVTSKIRMRDADFDTGEPFIVEETFGDFTAPNAVTVVPGGGSLVSIDTVAPLRVRFGSPFAFTVSISNTGLNDALMPILQIASPDGNPIALDAEGVSSGSRAHQFVPVGVRHPLLLAPGESLVVPVFGRAEAIGSTRLIVQDLSGDFSLVDWASLENYYRDDSNEDTWADTWNNFLGLAGESWDSLHHAMRLSAFEISRDTGTRVIRGSEVIDNLLSHAVLGLDSLDDLAVRVEGLSYDSRVPSSEETAFFDSLGDGAVAGGTDGCALPEGCNSYPPTCNPLETQFCRCEPYNGIQAVVMEAYARAVVVAGTVEWGSQVTDAFLRFLSNTPANGRVLLDVPQFSDLWRSLRFDFNLQLEARLVAMLATERYIDCARAEGEGCGEIFPVGLTFIDPATYLTECELDRNIDFGGGGAFEPGFLLAGGGGRGRNGALNIQCPPDQRIVSGTVVVERKVDDCGRTTSLRGRMIDVHWRIIDTIDFCPGKLGDGKERLLTVPMCRLERSGDAFDIGIDVSFDTEDLAISIPRAKLRDCEVGCERQPPGSSCTAPCGPNGLAGQCSENGSNDGGKECGGEETIVDVVASFDPNLKTGPQGFGPENWTSAVSPLPYRIDFENLADATAPAGRVVVTDELDPRLNALSVRLGDMVLSGTTVEVPDNAISFQTEVDLIAERGVIVEVTAGVDTTVVPARVFWIFQSIDPATGEAPLDPFLGFLPPEDGSGRGQGFVTFTVRPKNATADGAVIENEAEIVFDANAPILTNMVSNTLDRALPSSTVLPLPSVTTETTLLVSVVGSDTSGGSGLDEFRLFMSTDSGPFQAIGASIDGDFVSPVLAAGHVYGFASQAVDRAGGVEPLPVEPDTIVAIPSIALAAASDTGVVGDGITNDPTPTMLVVSAPLSSVAVSVVGRGTPVEVTTDELGRAVATVGGSGLNDGTYTVVATSSGVSVSTAIVVDTVVTGELAWRVTTVHGDVGPSVTVLPEGLPFVESRLGGIAEFAIDAVGKSPCTVSTPTVRIDGTALDGNAIANPPIVLVEPTASGWLARCATPIVTPGVYCITLSGAVDCAGNLRPITQRRRTIVMLPGDATGDRRVNNTDVGGVASLLGTDPIDLSNALHVRSDIDRDGDVDAADLQVVLAERGKDARFIAVPCPPESAESGVAVATDPGVAQTGSDQGASSAALLSATSRPPEGGVAAANSVDDGALSVESDADTSSEIGDPSSPLMLVAIEPLPGFDAALLADTERFHSIVPWGDDADGRMWWLAEVSVETVEQLMNGALDTMVAFSSPVRKIGASTLAFDGREMIVAVKEGTHEEALRKIRAALPVIGDDQFLGAHNGRALLRLSTQLPDGVAVRALAESLVDRGLAIDAAAEVHFGTTGAVELVQHTIALLPELAEPSSRVVVLGTSDDMGDVADAVDTRVITLPAYTARSEDGVVRIYGRSSSQVEVLLKAMALDPTVVVDFAREVPRTRLVEFLWTAVNEAIARERPTPEEHGASDLGRRGEGVDTHELVVP
jgi:hypothetical protein